MNTVPPFQLTLSAVKRGYEESGLKPCRGWYANKEVCCPITAAAIAYYGRSPDFPACQAEIFAREIGLTNDQFSSYIAGVDGLTGIFDGFYYNLGREHAKALGL